MAGRKSRTPGSRSTRSQEETWDSADSPSSVTDDNASLVQTGDQQVTATANNDNTVVNDRPASPKADDNAAQSDKTDSTTGNKQVPAHKGSKRPRRPSHRKDWKKNAAQPGQKDNSPASDTNDAAASDQTGNSQATSPNNSISPANSLSSGQKDDDRLAASTMDDDAAKPSQTTESTGEEQVTTSNKDRPSANTRSAALQTKGRPATKAADSTATSDPTTGSTGNKQVTRPMKNSPAANTRSAAPKPTGSLAAIKADGNAAKSSQTTGFVIPPIKNSPAANTRSAAPKANDSATTTGQTAASTRSKRNIPPKKTSSVANSSSGSSPDTPNDNAPQAKGNAAQPGKTDSNAKQPEGASKKKKKGRKNFKGHNHRAKMHAQASAAGDNHDVHSSTSPQPQPEGISAKVEARDRNSMVITLRLPKAFMEAATKDATEDQDQSARQSVDISEEHEPTTGDANEVPDLFPEATDNAGFSGQVTGSDTLVASDADTFRLADFEEVEEVEEESQASMWLDIYALANERAAEAAEAADQIAAQSETFYWPLDETTQDNARTTPLSESCTGGMREGARNPAWGMIGDAINATWGMREGARDVTLTAPAPESSFWDLNEDVDYYARIAAESESMSSAVREAMQNRTQTAPQSQSFHGAMNEGGEDAAQTAPELEASGWAMNEGGEDATQTAFEPEASGWAMNEGAEDVTQTAPELEASGWAVNEATGDNTQTDEEWADPLFWSGDYISDEYLDQFYGNTGAALPTIREEPDEDYQVVSQSGEVPVTVEESIGDNIQTAGQPGEASVVVNEEIEDGNQTAGQPGVALPTIQEEPDEDRQVVNQSGEVSVTGEESIGDNNQTVGQPGAVSVVVKEAIGDDKQAATPPSAVPSPNNLSSKDDTPVPDSKGHIEADADKGECPNENATAAQMNDEGKPNIDIGDGHSSEDSKRSFKEEVKAANDSSGSDSACPNGEHQFVPTGINGPWDPNNAPPPDGPSAQAPGQDIGVHYLEYTPPTIPVDSMDHLMPNPSEQMTGPFPSIPGRWINGWGHGQLPQPQEAHFFGPVPPFDGPFFAMGMMPGMGHGQNPFPPPRDRGFFPHGRDARPPRAMNQFRDQEWRGHLQGRGPLHTNPILPPIGGTNQGQTPDRREAAQSHGPLHTDPILPPSGAMAHDQDTGMRGSTQSDEPIHTPPTLPPVGAMTNDQDPDLHGATQGDGSIHTPPTLPPISTIFQAQDPDSHGAAQGHGGIHPPLALPRMPDDQSPRSRVSSSGQAPIQQPILTVEDETDQPPFHRERVAGRGHGTPPASFFTADGQLAQPDHGFQHVVYEGHGPFRIPDYPGNQEVLRVHFHHLPVPQPDQESLPAPNGTPEPPAPRTGVWCTNLPPNCTYNMLLKEIYHTGKVYTSSLLHALDGRTTACAEIIFFDEVACNLLLTHAERRQLIIDGHHVNMRASRSDVHPISPNGPESRVLQFTAPDAKMIEWEVMRDIFDGICRHDIDHFKESTTADGKSVLTVAFASYFGQADRIYYEIKARRQAAIEDSGTEAWWASIDVEFQLDPCSRFIGQRRWI